MIVFGPGSLERAESVLGAGYTLLSTSRAAAAAPAVVSHARTVVEVPPGNVESLAAALRGQVTGNRLVALGGGRVIDVAKALAAADPPRTVVAIPTTLSAAEMTGIHRHARGVPPITPRVRPAVVINDPSLSGSQPPAQLAASSANALGHALIGLLSDRASPISAAIAREGAVRIAAGWRAQPADRTALALGALMAGWAVDHSGLGLHHVLAQTAVLVASLPHAIANAALLPVSAAALRFRRPEEMAALDQALGVAFEQLAEDLRARAGAHGLGSISGEGPALERAVEAAALRPELARVPPPPDRAELAQLYRTAARDD